MDSPILYNSCDVAIRACDLSKPVIFAFRMEKNHHHALHKKIIVLFQNIALEI